MFFYARSKHTAGAICASVVAIVALDLRLKWWAILQSAYLRGDIATALRASESALLSDLRGDDWPLANAIINALILCGLYREALSVEHRLDAPRQKTIARSHFVLAEINLAEAEYNLGDWTAASARLERVASEAEETDLNRSVLRIQRAWIAANISDPQAALRDLDQVELKHIPREFKAEYHFTRAVALFAAGQLDAAGLAANDGLKASVRPSSERNAYFLLGRIQRALGALAEARIYFKRACSHVYVGQGGAELLAYGDLLTELGAFHEAKVVWQLAIERDPQSAAADAASDRVKKAVKAE